MSEFIRRIEERMLVKRTRRDKGLKLLEQAGSLMGAVAEKYPELMFERHHGRPRLYLKAAWRSPMICEADIHGKHADQIELTLYYTSGTQTAECSTVGYIENELINIICHWLP